MTYKLRLNLNLSLHYMLSSTGEWLWWVSRGRLGEGNSGWRWTEESKQLLWDRLIGEVGIWEPAVHGSWRAFGGIAALWGCLRCVKGSAVTFQSQHMGTDIMHLGLMPGSGKGYDLTLGLQWNLAIRHASLDQWLQLLAHLFTMQVACGGCSFHESEQSADLYKWMAVEPCASGLSG